MRNNNWKLKETSSSDDREKSFIEFKAEVRKLRDKIRLPDAIIKLLYMRGVDNYAKIHKYFKPTREKLYNPFDLKDAQTAADRIIAAINNKENVMVLGDYDVDGTCGVSMFYLFLKNFGIEPEVYIPDRIDEGYGISFKSIDFAKEKNIDLVISIDCGITAVDKIKYANSLGIDFIICDHHQPPDVIPDAIAVLDPLRNDDTYPFQFLSGTGVAFKLIQAVCKQLDKNDYPFSLLDFVAIATCSDIVPLIDENRILVNEGLAMINDSDKIRPSIKMLIEISKITNPNISSTNIVYSIAPRINAVGRLGDAKRAVELMTSDKEEELKELAKVLNEVNNNRQEIDKTITENAINICEQFFQEENTNSLVVYNEEWHPGVIGIVAARLVEKFHLPSIVLTKVNGVAKGSARSINGFNIYDALKQCEDQLIQFGGHYHAAGLELEVSNVREFRKSFNEIASSTLTNEQLEPELFIDLELRFDDITAQLVNILKYFEPFGPANMTPVFVTRDVQIVGEVREVKNNTLLFKVREYDPKSYSNVAFDCVFFSSDEYVKDIVPGKRCDLCYSIEKSIWRNTSTTKLRVRDAKFYYN